MADLFPFERKLTPEEEEARRGTEIALAQQKALSESAKPSFLDRLAEAYTSNPGGQPFAAQPEPIRATPPSPANGGYTPVPPQEPQMSMGEPARAPPPAPAPVARRAPAPAAKSQGVMYPEPIGPANAPPAPPPAPAPVTKPAAPAGDPEYDAALASSDAKRKSLLAAVLKFASGFASNGEELRKGIDERINSPVADLLAKKKFLDERTAKGRETEEYEKKKSLDDPMSSPSQMAAKLALSKGLIKPGQEVGFTANMFDMMAKGATLEQAASHQSALEKQAAADLVSREKVAGSNNASSERIARGNNETALEVAGLKGGAGPKNTSELISVPGTPVGGDYDLGDVPIKGTEAEKFRDGLAAANKLRATLGTLKTLMKDKSRLLPGSTTAARIQGLAGKLVLSDKEKENLGAISNVDLNLLTDVLGKNLDGFDLTGSKAAKLDEFDKGLTRDLDANVNARHFKKRGGAPAAAPAGPRPTRTVGGVTKEWDGTKWVP